MDYLVCDRCKQRYELLPDEKPEDFNLNCGCGGTLHKHLDDNEQFLLERNLGYTIKPSMDVGSIFNILKIGLYLIAIISIIMTFIVFWPLGILALLGLCAYYASKQS